jgi:rare lipoprotein A
VLFAAVEPARADSDAEWLRSLFSGSSRIGAPQTRLGPASTVSGQTGVASYYWQPQRVAAGGTFNPNALTAAHKTLPFGTRVRVTHLESGRSVDVVINDRGPYVKGRVIDLSRRAAQKIGMTAAGVAKVRIERI